MFNFLIEYGDDDRFRSVRNRQPMGEVSRSQLVDIPEAAKIMEEQHVTNRDSHQNAMPPEAFVHDNDGRDLIDDGDGDDEEDDGRIFGEPDDAFVPTPLAQRDDPKQPELTPKQIDMLATVKHLSEHEMNSDEAINIKLDIVFGAGVVPMYMHFDLRDKTDLTDNDMDVLRALFFKGDECAPDEIEKDQINGRPMVRIKHGRQRHIRIQLDGAWFRLAQAMDYPPPLQGEVTLSFTLSKI